MGDEVLPGLALLAGVALAGEREGALDLLVVDRLGRIGLVLLDHREQIAEQRALAGGQLAGDRVGARRAGTAGGLADAGVPAAILVADSLAVVGLGNLCAGYTCALLRRNRMASRCLARQAP